MAVRLKDISKEYEISFEKLLCGVAREELVKKIACSPFGEHIWLREPKNLGLESYKLGMDRTLNYVYSANQKVSIEGTPGAALNDRLRGAILLSLTGGKSKGLERIEGKIGNDKSLYLDAYIEGKRVPFRVSISPVTPGINTPKPEEFTLLRGKETFSYIISPPELEISRDLYKVFKNLELISDMDCFERIFDLVMTCPIEGKLVWSELNSLISSKINISEIDYMKRIEKYKTNPEMKKKWDNHIKRQKLLTNDWKKVINAMLVFVKPIWESIENDTPFIGDWVPELGRFL